MNKKTTQVNLRRLIEILGHHLYSKPEICIRELIQNAHDSLLIRSKNFPNIKSKLEIRIKIDKEERTLTFIDSGIGMNLDEIDERLSRIANSNKDQLQNQIVEASDEMENVIVGSFGIGFLSSFLIAESVTVKTRKANSGGNAILWSSIGDEHYETSEQPCSDDFIGTIVTLTIKSQFHQFLDEDWLTKRIRKYCDFIIYPIYLNELHNPVNLCMPPWRNPESVEEDYAAYLKRVYPDIDMAVTIPVIWGGQMGGVVGIPSKTSNKERGIALHNDRFFVCETKQLLPQSLSFLIGVVDTNELDLLLSREQFINNSKSMRFITKFILKFAEGLKQIAQYKKQTFNKILQNWGSRIKWAAIENDAIFEQVAELMPMRVGGEELNMTTLHERSNTAGDTNKILYMDNENTQRQYSSILSKFGHPVVETTNEIDFRFLKKYAYKKKIEVEPADIGIASLLEPVTDESWNRVIKEMSSFAESDTSGQNYTIRMANFKMPDIPAIICTQQDWLSKLNSLSVSKKISSELLDLFQNLKQKSRVLFLNIKHPLVQELKNIVAKKAVDAGTLMKSKIYLMRGLLNAAAVHSGRYDPVALNLFLQDATSALQFIAEQQNRIIELENRFNQEEA